MSGDTSRLLRAHFSNRASRPKNRGLSPVVLQIPQYDMHVEAKTGKKAPVVLVQAEEGQGIRMAGYVSVRDGTKAVCLLNELRLLGTSTPK